MKSAQIFLKGGMSLVGVLGLATLVAAPASAESALRGSYTRVSPAGFVRTVSGEVTLPAGLYFPGNDAGDYTFTGGLALPDPEAEGAADPQILTLNGGTPVVVPAAPEGTTIKQAVIAELGELDPTVVADLDAYTAILKAAAGADGLE